MSGPRAPYRRNPGVTIPLQDVQSLALDDNEHSFYAPRGGDWAFLALVVIVLLGTGLFAWYRLGASGAHAGRAIFFGFLLLSVYWSAVVYTVKLSVSVRVGPSGMSIVRGPWRTELAWREVARLVERAQLVEGQRLRWVVALARDGRRLQIREDMVDDYIRFRMEIYERYRQWRDHGGTWGATGGGPFQARETISAQVTWWGIAAGLILLPALYFIILLPETGLFGWILLLIGLGCLGLSLRALARRQTYIVDAKAIAASHFGKTIVLPWREVARVERSRTAFSGALKAGIAAGRFALDLATRNDKRLRTFEWYPRIPEYLTIRGAGRHVRVSLHKVARPDELLAWVEFYERIGRRASASENLRRTPPISQRPTHDSAPVPDMSAASGPLDPWGAGQAGMGMAGVVDAAPSPAMPATPTASNLARNAAWLRDETDAATDEIFSDSPVYQGLDFTPAERASNTGAAQPTGDIDIFEDLPTAEMQAAQPARPAQPPAQPAQAAYPSQPAQRPAPTTPPLDSELYPTQSLYAFGDAPSSAGPPNSPFAPITPQQATDPDFDDDDLGFDFPEAPTEAPGEPAENLAESFTPWRDDANWQPPQLPRFGPPVAPPPEAQDERERHDSGEFRADEFLR